MNKEPAFMQVVVSILSLCVLGACGQSGKDEVKPQSEEAVGLLSVPSPDTMSINLDVSGQGSDLDALAKIDSFVPLAINGTNHLQAMIYIAAVDSNIAQPLKLPVNLLKAAGSKNPVQTGIDTWVYSFDVLQNNRVWTANLTGIRTSSSATDWTMKVTSAPSDINGCCTDTLLFQGQSSSTGSGSWQIFDMTRPKDSAKLFAIIYDFRNAADKVLQFTINGNSSQSRLGVNSTVRYSSLGDLLTLELNDISDQGKRLISWSKDSKAGEYTDSQNNKVCWDSYLNNFSDAVCK